MKLTHGDKISIINMHTHLKGKLYHKQGTNKNLNREKGTKKKKMTK